MLFVEAVALVAFSLVAVFATWAVLLVAWFVMAALMQRVKPRIPPRMAMWHIAAVVGFPLVATGWKWAQQRFDITDGGAPNRVQHFVWAACVVGMLLPVLTRWWRGRRLWEQVLMAVGTVSVFGNFAEVMEYVNVRDEVKASHRAARYTLGDTMVDLCVNAAGAMVAALLLIRIDRGVQRRRQSEPPHLESHPNGSSLDPTGSHEPTRQ
jgi:hypothetical protein